MNQGTYQERKDFVARMVSDFGSINWAKELSISKKIFSTHSIDMLNDIEPPFNMKSTAWFLGEKGKKWLTNKQKEYYHVTRLKEELVEEHEEKAGEDLPFHREKSLIDFLNE